MVEDKNYVDMCAVCKEAVPKSDLVYQKGKVFHSECFNSHGSSFPVPNDELEALSAKTRVELVQMKNLKARAEQGILKLNPTKSKKSSNKTRSKKSKTRKQKKKSKKVNARKRKAAKVSKKKKSKSKTKAKRSKPKRRPKSKARKTKRRR